MALHLNHDHQGRIYFALSCDACGAMFTCYDDGCYSVASLRTEAVFAGWDAGTRPEQTHRCPSCLATGTTAGPAGVRPLSAVTAAGPDADRVTSHDQGDLDGCRPRRPSSASVCTTRRSASEVTPDDQKEPEPGRQVPAVFGTPAGRSDTGQSAPSCVIATGYLNGTVRVAVVGEIDIAVHDRLRAALAAALRAGAAELVVDLAATTFLDAGGISVLLHARREARRAGRHLRITDPQHSAVRRVLEITEIFGVLTSGHNDVPAQRPGR